MAGIGVILNPHSKSYKKDPHKMQRMGFIVGDKASCHATETLEDLRSVAEEFKSRNIDILAISGGDGTNHCTLTTFIEVYGDKPLPKIAFLRGGTLNTVARTLGIHGSSEKILSNLLFKYHEDKPFETTTAQLMRINNEYGFIFGMGVIYNFMEAYYQYGPPNLLIAAWTLFHAVGSAAINGPFSQKMFERFGAEVTVNGEVWPYKDYSALYSGSINQLGFDFKVFYLVDKQPDKFHAIGFSLPPRDILAYMPKMFFGKPSGCPNLLEEATDEMVIKLAKPLAYTIDGDMKPALDFFRVTLGPKITVIKK